MQIAIPNLPTGRPLRSIEDFRGDFEGLATFIQHSWAENKSQSLLYTPEFLASCFSYPGASFHLAPTLYEASRIAGFIAGFPRRVHYQGKELRIIVVSFLTVASQYKKRGYGMVLWSELVRRARAAGFAGAMSYCIDGDPMNTMMLGCYEHMKVPANRIFSIQYLMRFIMPERSQTDSEPFDPRLMDSFMRAAVRASETVPLRRVWSREEVDWQCRQRADAMFVSHSSGGRVGFLTGYGMSIADRDRTKCLIIEDMLWNDLAREERQILVQKLVDRAGALGVRLAVVPLLGYADPQPFVESGFHISPRLLHTYFGRWDQETAPEPVSSFYLDVF